MNDNQSLDNLLSALTDKLSDEELLLSALQSDIAAEIASARIAKGLSQKELADALGVKQALVSRWESGSVNYTLQTLVRISLELGIKIKSPYLPSHLPQYLTHRNLIDFHKVQQYVSSTVSPNPVWNAENAISGGDLKEM